VFKICSSYRGSVIQRGFHSLSPGLAVAIAQASIFFGLIRDVTGTAFRRSTYLKRSTRSGLPVITLLQLWKNIRWAESTGELCEDLPGLISEAMAHARFVRPMKPSGELVYLSIEILAWSVLAVISPETLTGDFWKPKSLDGIVERQMGQARWCPSLIKKYRNSTSPGLLYYLSTMSPTEGADHDSCDKSYCEGYDIDEANYVPGHTNPDCRCTHMGPKIEEVAALIESGQIPILRLSKLSSGEIEIKVSRSKFGRPYTAISHVWSGGLGNPDHNLLPKCQLNYIFELLKLKAEGSGPEYDEIYSNRAITEPSGFMDFNAPHIRAGTLEKVKSIYVWIDTLCLPVGFAYQSIKRKAINKMAMVYAASHTVLVIDPTITKISSKQETDLANAAQLLVCPWMSRCWTYQEACLARKLSFAFKDTFLDLRTWASSHHVPPERSRSPFEHALIMECVRLLTSMPDVVSQSISSLNQDHVQEFTRIWSEMATRTATRRQDVHVVFATLLGLKAEEIMSSEREKRMLPILRAQTYLPMSMLYLHHPDNIELVPGCGWVPVYPSGSLFADCGRMEWTSSGSGFSFRPLDDDLCALVTLSAIQSHQKFSLRGNALTRVSESHQTCVEVELHSALRLGQLQGHEVHLLMHEGAKSSRGVGACFILLDSADAESLSLEFVCTLAYQRVALPQQMTETAPKASTGKVMIEGRASPSNMLCILKCGKHLWSPSSTTKI
jgi:hypothetical protein